MLENVYILPALMAASFLAILFVGKRIDGGRGAHKIGVPAIGLSWILSLVAAVQWIDKVRGAEGGDHGTDEHALGGFGRFASWIAQAQEEHGEEHGAVVEPIIETVSWLRNGGVDIDVGTYVDGLTVLLLVVVTSISLLVHIYSIEYVRDDPRYTHFFAFLSLFTASMLFFVMSENVLQMIVGWELVGVCSFVLIGHWWEEKENTDAALKAFLTNRVGDIGLLVGMSILFWGAGTFSIEAINGAALDGTMSHLVLLVASCCLLAAVASKSGQFVLHTWLPDAMAGPTPVSALIHAATMVVAGVYMVARLYPVFYEGFSIEAGGANLMAIVGGVTVIGGGLLAFVQNDIKKVLAYSTVSQLGYMVMALGVGAWAAAVFHLFTHAFFKACLFLGAGSLSHACHHSFDMKADMGGLRKVMPQTFVTFIVASAALAGFFPLAGFWSKDEILVSATENGFEAFMIVGLVGAFLTAAYMTRVIYLVFFGEYRGHAHPHESPPLITVPLWILGGMSVIAGFVNATAFGFEYIIDYVELPRAVFPELAHADFDVVAALIATAVGLAGVGAMYLYYWQGVGFGGFTQRSSLARGGYAVLYNKYYLDHLYTDIVVGTTKGPIARAAYWTNQNTLDKVVDTVGSSARDGGQLVYRYVDQALVDGVVNGAGFTAEGSGQVLRGVQSGRVQQYGALLFGAAAILAILFVILV